MVTESEDGGQETRSKKRRFGGIVKWGGLGLIVVFVGIQLVPVERTNPPVETEVSAPEDVHAVLQRACYDCHSNETQWPWYSRLAPASWLLARDVTKARGELNFSAWNRLGTEEQAEAPHEVWEEVAEGEMPPWFYLPLHPEARLSEQDRAVLRGWSGSAGEEESEDQ